MIATTKKTNRFTCSFCGFQTDVGGLDECPGCSHIDYFMASKAHYDDLRGQLPDEFPDYPNVAPGYIFSDGHDRYGFVVVREDGQFWCGDLIGSFPTLTQASFELYRFLVNN